MLRRGLLYGRNQYQNIIARLRRIRRLSMDEADLRMTPDEIQEDTLAGLQEMATGWSSRRTQTPSYCKRLTTL